MASVAVAEEFMFYGILSSLAIPLSFAVYIVAWVLQLVVYFGFPYSSDNNPGWVFLFSIFPWTLLSKGVLDLADATTGTNTGITWSNRNSYCLVNPPSPDEIASTTTYWKSSCVMPLGQIFWVLFVQAIAYLFLAIYLDHTLPSSNEQQSYTWA
eukprot:gene19213-25830_t